MMSGLLLGQVSNRRIAEAPLSEIGTVAAKHALAAADKDPK